MSRVIRLPERNDEPYSSKKIKFDGCIIPHGWLNCPNYGHKIDFIVPSKVPLDDSFNHLIPFENRYSFRQLLNNNNSHEKLSSFGVDIGLVVDLTDTDRYYSTVDITKQHVKYLKIRCQGRDCVPDNEAVNRFVFEVERYISSQWAKKGVLVHCTHGHNRTGYMIVHYLMRTRKASSVSEAIQIFAEARPPGIYKKDYIDSLYEIYHETKLKSSICPPTPDWKRSSGSGEDDDVGVCHARILENPEKIVMRMTNDDVLGDKIPDEQEFQLRTLCYDMLNLQRGQSLSFPGSHPVSLDSMNLQMLRRSIYYATWKADGTRYMLLLSSYGCFLIDRRFKFRRVQMRFPRKNDMTNFHEFTLLDGEMVIDTDHTVNPPKQERRFLIYDMIAINGVSIVEQPFCKRWNLIETEVVEPRKNDRQSNKCYRYDLELFGVRTKGFWLLSTVEKQLKKMIPKLSHGADGLIFQGWDDPYVPRTHKGLFKWKYPKMNSVDFLFEVGKDGAEYLYLHERGNKRLMYNNRVVFQNCSDPPSSYSGKIIECSWDVEENVWVYKKTRVDKSAPNEFNTYINIMKSIKDNITEKVLLDEIDEIICLPMYADRIQNGIAEAQQKVKPLPAKF